MAGTVSVGHSARNTSVGQAPAAILTGRVDLNYSAYRMLPASEMAAEIVCLNQGFLHLLLACYRGSYIVRSKGASVQT